MRLASREASPGLTNSRHLLILHLDERASGPCTALLLWLLVGGSVESKKQDQVRGQDHHASEGGELLTGADTGVWRPWEVCGAEVGVGSEVDEAEIDDELNDLHHGDVLLPPDTDAARRLEVVPVHDDVDHQVEGDWNPGDGGMTEELGVAKESGSAVVVGVKEGWGVRSV